MLIKMKNLFNHWKLKDQNVMIKICSDVLIADLEIKPVSNDFCFIFIEGRNRKINYLQDFAAFRSTKIYSEYNYPIFCFVKNIKKFLNNRTDLIKKWNINIIQIDKLKNLDEYSNFCIKELYFILNKKYENIVTIQSDGFFIKNGWEKFILDNNFDYIGSHWQHIAGINILENKPKKLQNKLDNFFTQVGNGAFSYRKASKMRKISKTFSKYNLIERNAPNNKKPPEDLFFSLGFMEGICKLPTLKNCCEWSKDPITLDMYEKKASFGFHHPVEFNQYCCNLH